MNTMLTSEEYESLLPYKAEMEKIVRNAAASSISIGLRETAVSITRRLGYSGCTTCSSGLYRIISTVYNKFIEYQNELQSSLQTKPEGTTDKKRRREKRDRS